ncbi:MAG: hypothetical protein LUC60_07445, partial [Lachnospiraceae bacterium]|nr:hypothetical protein [Lachnospiraceae bacterium]
MDGTYTIFPEKKQEVEHTPVSGRQMSLFDFMGLEDSQPETDEKPELSGEQTEPETVAEPDIAIESENQEEAVTQTESDAQEDEEAASEVEPELQEKEYDREEDTANRNPEIVARFQSTAAMQDGYVEDIAILQYPNGKFYNHYGYDEERGMGAATAGPFDTLEDARQTVLAHRPDAREVDLQEITTSEQEVEGQFHTVAANEPQMMPREAYAEYLSIKERYPDTLVGFETEGHYEFYGDHARMV